MKKSLFLGFITLAYGMSLQALASDTATLTITGRVVEPTCSTDVVNNTVQQRCGQTLHQTDINNVTPTPAQGIVTEIVAVPGDSTRQIVLNRYD
ncbi:DUF2574 family protein [Salmonella enterica subsp. enterica serovar Kiambu]|uniref:DUF2574 family protein n=4 Tax=Salmonella enterica TaxID=28901 RepID=A0A3Z1WX33_SALET|nr:DUF2574 family protein [Salmonella enterica]AZS94961.1 DUF2574 family protein [Salmonella enterica subsp. enterica serovar Moero]AZT76082.1 DUF2574 family protein [Salmonella enterica subsp. enterica serovar Bareilly]EAB6693346.1 DUF2574 family protein [Salmonella enterica subsp. enterica serovar Kapemba]EAB7165512.1 DUF2574 family protein [Salmonella enterica subsp. enterica]EBG0409254.1 DUF2574 family protein [Salmonella enterica subsp. enterica serovar Irumu]EBY6724535.1 DUF2574 family 